MIRLDISQDSTRVNSYIQDCNTYSDILPCGGENLFYTLKKKYINLRSVTTEKIVITYEPSGLVCIINNDAKAPDIDKYKSIPGVRYIPDRLITFCANDWVLDSNGNKKYITDSDKLKRKVNKTKTLLDLFNSGRITLKQFRAKLNRIVDA